MARNKREFIKWFLGNLAAIVFFLVLITPAQSIAADITKLSISHIGPTTSPIIKLSITPMIKELEATGKAKVTMYGAGSAYGNPRKFLKQIEKGIVDMAFGVTSYEGGRFPLNLLFTEPFTVEDSLAGTRAYMKLFQNNKYISGEWPNTVKVMQVQVLSPYQLHTRVPVKKFEDVAGKRIITTLRPFKIILGELGASAAVMPVTVVYENLQKGVVDGYIGTWSSTLAFRTIEITNHHIVLNLSVPPSYLAINKKRYNTLPAQLKAIIDKWSTIESAVKLVDSSFNKVDAKAVAAAKKKGHVIIYATPAERNALRKRFKYVTDDYIKQLEAKGLPAGQVYKSIVTAINQESSQSK